MEEFGPTNVDLQSPSSLSRGASSGTRRPLGARLGDLTSTTETKDGVVDGVSDQDGDDAGVMVELLGSDGWIVSTSRLASPTTPLTAGVGADWGVAASSNPNLGACTGSGITVWAFFVMTLFGFPVATLF